MARRSQAQWPELFRKQEVSGQNTVGFFTRRTESAENFLSLRWRQLLAGTAPAVSAASAARSPAPTATGA